MPMGKVLTVNVVGGEVQITLELGKRIAVFPTTKCDTVDSGMCLVPKCTLCNAPFRMPVVVGDGEAVKGKLQVVSLRERVDWGGTVRCTFMVNHTDPRSTCTDTKGHTSA